MHSCDAALPSSMLSRTHCCPAAHREPARTASADSNAAPDSGLLAPVLSWARPSYRPAVPGATCATALSKGHYAADETPTAPPPIGYARALRHHGRTPAPASPAHNG